MHSLDYCFDSNGRDHHTDKYDAMHRTSVASNLVIRRGQPFRLLVSFNRPYNFQRDSVSFIFTLRDDDRPNHGHGTLVGTTLQHDSFNYGDAHEWSCILDGKHGDVLEILIKPAANAAIGEWNIDVDTQLKVAGGGAATFKSPNTIFILFNPWCREDSVYFEGINPGNELTTIDFSFTFSFSFLEQTKPAEKNMYYPTQLLFGVGRTIECDHQFGNLANLNEMYSSVHYY